MAPVSMCDDCKSMDGAAASKAPHRDLVEYHSKNLSGSPEPPGMRYFTCNRCGQEWIRYVEGWAAQG
jgi:hypothetical protein